MPELFLRSDARDEARALVLEHHYSHKWPTRCNASLTVTWHSPGGLFGDRGPAVAAITFGYATGWKETTLELVRLVKLPGVDAPLTSLIGAAMREVRYQALDSLVVSYADPEEGHHGGIYQAGSWEYAGPAPYPSRVFYIDGERLHERQVSDLYGTSDKRKISDLLGARFTGTRILSPKHLYWRALNRRGKAKAKRLGLKSLPYPKPQPPAPTQTNSHRPNKVTQVTIFSPKPQ